MKEKFLASLLAGREYGSGSGRDWAAKGPHLLGVRAIIAESFERIHRSNLVGMGIVPLEYLPGQNADRMGLTGKEMFTIEIPECMRPRQEADVHTSDGKSFRVLVRFDTELELAYFKQGGILNYVAGRIIERQN